MKLPEQPEGNLGCNFRAFELVDTIEIRKIGEMHREAASAFGIPDIDLAGFNQVADEMRAVCCHETGLAVVKTDEIGLFIRRRMDSPDGFLGKGAAKIEDGYSCIRLAPVLVGARLHSHVENTCDQDADDDNRPTHGADSFYTVHDNNT
ncbi:hypothetical protein LP421_09070 [Rhizobium sp. RCAM05350]|nr:hypothetical protein LP421_09070 [Rhizobium sp. RCAM05350]